MDLKFLEKISDYIWEIPQSFSPRMLVPARVFANRPMLEKISSDRSLDQLVNVATLPGIKKYALAMPDAHEGYGFPVGGVAAISYSEGVISPGGIGYDINCGVRLLLTPLDFSQVKNSLERLAKELYKNIPSGVGRGGKIKLSKKEFDEVLNEGVPKVIKWGYGLESDLDFIESRGFLKEAEAFCVSEVAKRRGFDQLGTMGAGNHFVEVGRVEKIFDKEKARIFGLKEDQVTILIHTGSRGLGHQVATDYIREMIRVLEKYQIKLNDLELACAPFNSPEGKNYFKAMSAAANFAWSNRQVITHLVRNVLVEMFDLDYEEVKILYDVAHNIAKIEEYSLENEKKEKFIIHRKGATRAFGPGNKEIPSFYQETGQPVIIPGSMGTASYVLAGTKKSEEVSFGSTCHGAGRMMSRHAAKKTVSGKKIKDELRKEGIFLEAGSLSGIAEEAPLAYKDVDQVVEVVEKVGIALRVARLKPIAVVKG